MKVYRTTLTAVAYVSAVVYVEVDEDELEEGEEVTDEYIEDLALNQAYEGGVDWDFDNVDSDTIEVGTVNLRRGQ